MHTCLYPCICDEHSMFFSLFFSNCKHTHKHARTHARTHTHTHIPVALELRILRKVMKKMISEGKNYLKKKRTPKNMVLRVNTQSLVSSEANSSVLYSLHMHLCLFSYGRISMAISILL